MSLLELLLGHDPALLATGSLQMRVTPTVFAALAAFVVVGTGLLMMAGGAAASVAVRHRVVLWGLRSALLVLLLFLLMDPRLRIVDRAPVRGHVAVLLDDSQSMRIADADGGPSRAEALLDRLAPGRGDLARALERRFDVRYYVYGREFSALREGELPAFADTRSDLASALSSLADAAGADGLGSVIVAGDGAGEREVGGASVLASSLRALEAAGVQVHTLGFGAVPAGKDLELSDVRLPPRVLRGDTVSARVTLAHVAATGHRARVQVERDSLIVGRAEIDLDGDTGRSVVSLPIDFPEGGARTLVFRVAALTDERLTENNALTRVVQVRDEPLQILHVEGEPRYEVKFLRRAVAGDDLIRLRSLIRTAENKFYRLGIDDPSELSRGLPASDAELFRYHAVVLGSVGASLLDAAQQRRIQDYVARRGGGLVLLGGRNAFTEGGFSDGPIAALAPVVMPARPGAYRARVPLVPAVPPSSEPLLRIAPPDALEAVWQRLPPLTVVNPVRRAKPGATVLLRGEDGERPPLVTLAWHRYGRGTVVAFPVRDSWRWQMHADIPLDDMSHEHLWRGLLRHAARRASMRHELSVSRQVVGVGDEVRVDARVLDEAYRPREDVTVTLAVTTPDGDVRRLPLRREVTPPSHTARVSLPRVGRYDLRLEVDGEAARGAVAAVEATAAGREYHAPGLDVARLSGIAASTGGQYLPAARGPELLEHIDDVRTFDEVEGEYSLLQVPALLLLALLLACAEWIWRRRCALP